MLKESDEIENKKIVKEYRNLLKASSRIREKGDVKVIRSAFDLAVKAHSNMRRKSGEPYILHPLSVAKIAVQEIGLGTTSIVCALLHDVVEDTNTTLEIIEEKFGKKIAQIIDGLTKISGVFDHRSSPQAENFKKMMLTLGEDVRVILIKLCDRLHNMRTLDHMNRSAQLKISSETLYLYAPLAHRLGLYNIKTEMEDLGLKYTEPDTFLYIKRKLSETKEQRNRYIRKFIKPVKEEIKKLGLTFEIKGRPKSIYSINQKIKSQQIEFEDVYDLFAIRIIIDSSLENEKMSCWNTYSIISNLYIPNPDRLRDWVSNPKSNGYESLHTTVMGPGGKWVEVQIRTKRMDEIAERGYAAHWKYKEENNDASGLDTWLEKVREVLEAKEEMALDFLDDIKGDLFSEEIYVFTPKGELIQLPTNSSALDFAFAIHTQVGEKCIGAKVNHKLVSIQHKLTNGDQVEIITSAKQKPNKNWLNYVQTGRAKSKIKQTLKSEKRELAKIGRESLAKKFKRNKIPFSSKNILKMVQHFGLLNEQDLFFLFQQGKIKSEEIKLKNILEEKPTAVFSKTISSQSKDAQIKSKIVIGQGDADMKYQLAKCCAPIPGDEIIGFITVSEGVKIHRINCANAIRLMSQFGYRIIQATWANKKGIYGNYEVGINLEGLDSMGIVAQLMTKLSSKLHVNVKSINFSSNQGTFSGELMIEVNSTSEVENIIKEIQSVNNVVKVSRLNFEENSTFDK